MIFILNTCVLFLFTFTELHSSFRIGLVEVQLSNRSGKTLLNFAYNFLELPLCAPDLFKMWPHLSAFNDKAEETDRNLWKSHFSALAQNLFTRRTGNGRHESKLEFRGPNEYDSD